MIYSQVPHRIEKELATATPRRVRFTAATQKRRLQTWCLSLAPLVTIMLYGLHATESEEALRTRGVVTTGRVTSSTVVDSGRSHKDGLDSQLAIMYEFQANGKTVIARGIDDIDYMKRLAPGDPVTVTYLPDDPRSFVQGRIQRWQVVQKDLDWILGSTFVGVVGTVYIFVTENYFWRRRRLLRFGKVVAATVVSHHTTESGETATFSVRYEYPDMLGHKVAGTLAVSPKQVRDYPDGSRISVLRLPDSKEPGTPYAQIKEAEIIKSP